jgi:hypothetical protein
LKFESKSVLNKAFAFFKSPSLTYKILLVAYNINYFLNVTAALNYLSINNFSLVLAKYGENVISV